MSKKHPKIKVGDFLAFNRGSDDLPSYKVREVTKITPSGRIQCGEYILNPDLTIRGRSSWSTGPDRAEVITPVIADWIHRHHLIQDIQRKVLNDGLLKVSVDVLQQIRHLMITDSSLKSFKVKAEVAVEEPRQSLVLAPKH